MWDEDADNDNLDPRLRDRLPDARDGLTRLERIILWQLRVLEGEYIDRPAPTSTLYGRVVEHIDVSVAEFQRTLQRLIGITGR